MIGSRIAAEALRRGHTVTAVLRDPSTLPPELHPVRGDALDAASVASAVAGNDVVISAIGPKHDEAMSMVIDTTHALIAGAGQAGVERMIVVGGAGSLEVAPGLQLVDTPEFPAAWLPVARAHRDVLGIYRQQKDFDWTYVSPAAFISPGERTGDYRIGGEQLLVDEKGESRISAEDFAVAVIDEVEKGEHIRERMTVAY